MPGGRSGGGKGRRSAPIPFADGRSRREAFEARKAGLMNKAKELAETSGAPVAVLCSGIDGQGVVGCWPSTEAATAVVDRFLELRQGRRVVIDHADHVAALRDARGSMLAGLREGGVAAALGPWEGALDGMSGDALRELLASVTRSLAATRSRIRGSLQPRRRESVAENFVAAGEGHATGEVQVVRKKLRGAAAADDAAWMERLVEDLKEKPAAPFDPGMIEHINVGGYVMERDAYDFIRYDLGMFPPSLEPEPPEPDHDDEPLRLWLWDHSSFPRARRRPSEPPTCSLQNGRRDEFAQFWRMAS